MYIRKTRDRFDIETNYGYGWEIETSEYDLQAAKQRYKEYTENTSAKVRIIKRREKKHWGLAKNEKGEYITAHTVVDPETGEKYLERRTYQNNGWIRINCEYADGTTEEYYEKE